MNYCDWWDARVWLNHIWREEFNCRGTNESSISLYNSFAFILNFEYSAILTLIPKQHNQNCALQLVFQKHVIVQMVFSAPMVLDSISYRRLEFRYSFNHSQGNPATNAWNEEENVWKYDGFFVTRITEPLKDFHQNGSMFSFAFSYLWFKTTWQRFYYRSEWIINVFRILIFVRIVTKIKKSYALKIIIIIDHYSECKL